MAVIEGGVSAALVDVGAATKGMRSEVRPTDVGALGSYSVVNLSGTMAAGLGAAAPVYSCRWGDGTRAMVLRRFALWAKNITTAFSAGVFLFELVAARGFSASDTAGASILPTGNAQKMRTSFGTTLITDLRQSATAAITAGTRTLDAQPFAAVRGFVPATVVNYSMVDKNGGQVIPGASTTVYSCDPLDLFYPDVTAGEWPLVLVQNEGFILRATVPATGTWEFGVRLVWDEVATTAGYN